MNNINLTTLCFHFTSHNQRFPLITNDFVNKKFKYSSFK